MKNFKIWRRGMTLSRLTLRAVIRNQSFSLTRVKRNLVGEMSFFGLYFLQSRTLSLRSFWGRNERLWDNRSPEARIPGFLNCACVRILLTFIIKFIAI